MTNLSPKRRRQIAAAARRYWRKKTCEHLSDGLTTRGTRRKNHLGPAVLSRCDRQRIERRDRVLSGLTTRGTSRIRRISGGLDRNARMRLHTAAKNSLGISAREKPLKNKQKIYLK